MIDIGNLDWHIDYTYISVEILTNEQIDWLNAHPSEWHYGRGGCGIYFESGKDAAMFVLRWA